MNRPLAGTVQAAVRHILRHRTTGFLTRTRRITWRDSFYRVRRPQSGKQTVELTCPECNASLLSEVRDEARIRRTAVILLVLAAVCAIVFFVAFGHVIHEGGKTLPEGQSLPTPFPVSVVSIIVTIAATPTLFLQGRRYNGVSMLGRPQSAPGPRDHAGAQLSTLGTPPPPGAPPNPKLTEPPTGTLPL